MKSLVQVAKKLGIARKESSLAFKIKNLYECFKQRDILQLTVNPLMMTKKEKFIAANVSILMDPYSTFRQAEMNNFRDRT